MLVSAVIETSAPICIERFEDYKMLGRFTLRDEGKSCRSICILSIIDGLAQSGKTVAIGKVTKLIERSEDMPDVAALSLKAAS